MRNALLLLFALAAAGVGAYVGVRLAEADAPVEEPQALEFEETDEPLFARRAVAVDPAPDAGPASGSDPSKADPAPAPLGEVDPAGGERWSELNRMAIRALDAGDLQRAVAFFEQCARGVPDEPVFARNLAEALARRAVDRHERERPCVPCLADLERAVELAPERDDLKRLLARWRTEAEIESGFWRDQSQHFDLSFDGERDDILHGSHRLLEELEEAYGDLADLFGFMPVERGRARIRVVLYRREGFDKLTGLGDWAGGAFDGTVRVPLGDLAREESALRSVLRHELVHAFVLETGGREVPGWLNEGLAQWLELDRAESLVNARRTLEGADPFTLEELGGSLSTWEDATEIKRAYAQSILFVDHLAHHYGERVVFALVKGCRTGVAPGETFESLTRIPLETALEDLANGL